MLSTVGKFIYTKYWGLLYVEHCGEIYLHTILRITLCWALSANLFTQNTEDYFMLNTVGRFIYTKYLGLLLVEQYGNIYLCKILRNTLSWALWEDLFIQNTEEYCMLNTGKIYLHKILYVEHCEKISLLKILRNTVCWTEKIYLHTILRNTVASTVWRFIYTKYRGILYAEHCGKIYLHKILRNTLCWTLLEDLFTQNTEEYFILKTVGRFIYTKYWGILYAEHCGKIYLHKILRNTVCWTLWEYLFTQNTEEYFMLNTVRFIYTKYWGLLYVEHCGKIYLHKILRNTVCWTLWEDLFTQNTGDYLKLNTVGILT
jgi:hypothetical protein